MAISETKKLSKKHSQKRNKNCSTMFSLPSQHFRIQSENPNEIKPRRENNEHFLKLFKTF